MSWQIWIKSAVTGEWSLHVDHDFSSRENAEEALDEYYEFFEEEEIYVNLEIREVSP